MSRVIETVVAQAGWVKNGPGLHGSNIGYCYAGTLLNVIVDNPESPHDGWVLIDGPRPDPVRVDGTWKEKGVPGWFELAHLAPVTPDEHEYRLVIDAETGAVKSYVMIR